MKINISSENLIFEIYLDISQNDLTHLIYLYNPLCYPMDNENSSRFSFLNLAAWIFLGHVCSEVSMENKF